MKIDIIFDTVCPWCFIGKKRLEMALAARPHIQVKQNWKPFLLNPEMPPGGIDQTAYLIKKFGSQARINHMYGTLDEAGQSVEIDFAFNRISKTPNSISSHRLLLYAGRHGPVDSVVEALFVEFFIKGRDTGDTDVLVEIGATHGFEEGELRAYLESNDDEGEIYDLNVQAHRLGINGVPAFSFNSKFMITGAQDSQVLARMLDAAQATETAA
ncbi:MAG: disulfide bond formation protein DsbA [Rhodospirillaceae bacterium]|jgi:predicted DsbA family dithiol-disulfide isomerase